MKLYLVGGAVREHFFGQHPTDNDFAVEASSYEEMRDGLLSRGLTVWQERPEFVTLRGRLPAGAVGDFGGMVRPSPNGTVAADFTLCRAEAMYSDKRHPDVVTPADLLTDLARRDFTINAIAVDEEGEVIDPYDGRWDISWQYLRTVGDPIERFTEDPLRILRALRFAVRYDLKMDDGLLSACRMQSIVMFGIANLPHERVREELNKALSHDWHHTMMILGHEMAYVGMMLHRTQKRLWLKATTEDK